MGTCEKGCWKKESADIGVLVRGVKNENFPCPARLRALNPLTDRRPKWTFEAIFP